MSANGHPTAEEVKTAIGNRWPELFATIGLPVELLDGKHHPCPKCGGDDRFRAFTDGSGGAICNQCFNEQNGDGLATSAWWTGEDFPTTLRHAAEFAGLSYHNSNGRKVDVLATVAQAKGMPLGAMRVFGFHQAERSGRPVARQPLYNAMTEHCSDFDIGTGDLAKGKTAYKKPAGVGLPHVDGKPRKAVAGETWIIAEGKDAVALHALGFNAISLPGNKLQKQFAPWFDGVDVLLIPHRDGGGDDMVKQIGALLWGRAKTIKVATLSMEWKSTKGADVRDCLKLENGEALLRQAVEAAVDWTPPKPAEDESDSGKSPPLHLPSGRTDAANSRRFVEWFGAVVLYVALWSKWLAWDGKRWKADDTLRVEDMGKRVAQGLWKLLVETVAANPGMDAKQQKEIISFVKASNNTRGIRNMLELVRSDVAEVPETFDSYPWLLNCANGTIDLQTGELRKHRREDYITKLCPTEYRRSEPAPTWKRFLETTFAENEAVIRFVQRLLGYSLTGITTEHSLGIFHGCGSNGKSTLIEAVMGTIGDDYAQPAAPDLLLTKKGQHPTEIADLHGKRLIACIETDEGRRLAEGLVKQLTGGDRLKARRMREDFWAFTATHKLILACNHRPEIRGTDNGIWRRIHLVPFEVVFSGEQKDTSLPEKLKTEAEGILAWMVEGCLAWQREGLNPPPQVQAATNEYRAEQDTLAAFIENCCIVGNNYSAAAGDLFEAYKEFGGELSQTRFGKAMAERGFARGRFSFGSNRGRTSWSGIGMLDGGENSDF